MSSDEMKVDKAVKSAFRAVEEFSETAIGRTLTPKQLLAAVTVAAVEQATRRGLSGQSAAATLRDLADGVEQF